MVQTVLKGTFYRLTNKQVQIFHSRLKQFRANVLLPSPSYPKDMKMSKDVKTLKTWNNLQGEVKVK